jgi:hypothetical protein
MNRGTAVGVGVNVGAGVDVGSGVAEAVTVGMRVSIGRGVIGGCGGTLTHAAKPISKQMNHDHFASFMSRITLVKNLGFYGWDFDSIQ